MASDGASPFGVMSAGVPLQVEQVQGGRVGGWGGAKDKSATS